MRLTELQLNTLARLKSFEDVGLKLNKVGIYVGDVIRALRSAPLGGPILLEVNGRMIALGRDVAAKVFVERL